MKNQTRFEIHMPDDLFKELAYVSEAEGRSINNEIILLVRNSIQYYERAKGKIDGKKINQIDAAQVAASTYYKEEPKD